MLSVHGMRNSGDMFATKHVARASASVSRHAALNRLRPRFQRADEGRAPAVKQTRYQHSSNAGNFGDVVKHIFLSQLLEDAYQTPQTAGYDIIIDTHAGLGLYPSPSCQDFRSYAPSDTGHDAPFAAYQRALLHAQGELGPQAYPGSPFIISSYANGHLEAPAQGREPQASNVSITLCEIDQQAAAQLASNCCDHRSLQPRTAASSVRVLDGCNAWKAVPQILAQQIEVRRMNAGVAPKALVFIDPPFRSTSEHDDLLDCLHELAPLAEHCEELDIVVWFALDPRLAEANERLRAGAQVEVELMRAARDRRRTHQPPAAPPAEPTPSSRLLRSMALDAGADEMWARCEPILEISKAPGGAVDHVLPTLRSLAVDAGADELWAGLPEEEQARLRVLGSSVAPDSGAHSVLHKGDLGKAPQASGTDDLWEDLQGLERQRNPRGGSNAALAGRPPAPCSADAQGSRAAPWGSDGSESDLWEDLKRKQARVGPGNGGASPPARELGAAYGWLECWRAPEHDKSFEGLNGCGLLFFGASDAVERMSDWGFELAEAVVGREKAAYPQAGCFQEVGVAISEKTSKADPDGTSLQFWRRWG